MAEVGINKLYLFPSKVKELLKISDNTFDFSYPVSVELSLTNTCNFNCIWCSDAGIRQRLGGQFKKEVLFNLLEDLSAGGVKGICVEGGGEPTLHPYFEETINKISQLGMAVGLITNGSIFNYENLLDKFEWIRVSLDVANKKQMQELKGSDSFDKVMTNIRRMLQLRNKTVIGIGYVLSVLNLEGLDDITVKLKEMGVDYLHIRPVVDSPKIAISRKLELHSLKKYESKQFKVMIDALQENKIKGNANLPCRAHSLTVTIAGDGSVYICGRLNVYDWWKPIGNLNKTSFKKIWNGAERKKQMQQLLAQDFCQKHCPECRITKYNVLIDELKNTKTKHFI